MEVDSSEVSERVKDFIPDQMLDYCFCYEWHFSRFMRCCSSTTCLLICQLVEVSVGFQMLSFTSGVYLTFTAKSALEKQSLLSDLPTAAFLNSTNVCSFFHFS